MQHKAASIWLVPPLKIGGRASWFCSKNLYQWRVWYHRIYNRKVASLSPPVLGVCWSFVGMKWEGNLFSSKLIPHSIFLKHTQTQPYLLWYPITWQKNSSIAPFLIISFSFSMEAFPIKRRKAVKVSALWVMLRFEAQLTYSPWIQSFSPFDRPQHQRAMILLIFFKYHKPPLTGARSKHQFSD